MSYEIDELRAKRVRLVIAGMSYKNMMTKHKKRTPEFKEALNKYQESRHEANLIQEKINILNNENNLETQKES